MSNDEMTNGVKKAIEEFQSSVDVAYAQFASFVDSVIFGRLTNIYTIEHTMDYMVGFGFDARIEALYKKLCRFLYPKYPQMIVNHVKGYLETKFCNNLFFENFWHSKFGLRETRLSVKES